MKVINANELRIGDVFWYMDQAFAIDRIHPVGDNVFFFDVSTYVSGRPLRAIVLHKGFFADKTKLINLIYREGYEKESM
jgi:hypothetical protein